MNAAFVSDERDRDKNEITKSTTRCSFFESSKIRSERFISLAACHTLRVMLSEAKHLWLPAS